MTTFFERPEDYLGETVTAAYEPRHALEGERATTTCFDMRRHVRDDGDPCGVLVVADGPARYRDVNNGYAGTHRWNVRRHRQGPDWGAR